MNPTKQIISIIIAVILPNASYSEEPDREPITGFYLLTKITAKIIGEDGKAIEGADVQIRLNNVEEYNDTYNDFIGKSNASGEFSAEGKATGYFVEIIANKNGYYQSRTTCYPYLEKDIIENSYKTGDKLQPWNPTIPIILKKIGKPVPMYVRGSDEQFKDIPSLDEVHGFDLVANDWVAPRGKGKVADLQMHAKMDVKDRKNYDAHLDVSFPNKGDGWIPVFELKGVESDLKYPREAPATGYRTDAIKIVTKTRDPFDETLPRGGHPYGYILRLRTQLDEKGEVVSAIYAKIVAEDLHPPIDDRRLYNPFGFRAKYDNEGLVDGKKEVYFAMNYYLNPKPNDRTLEYDQTYNLAEEIERAPGNFPP